MMGRSCLFPGYHLRVKPDPKDDRIQWLGFEDALSRTEEPLRMSKGLGLEKHDGIRPIGVHRFGRDLRLKKWCLERQLILGCHSALRRRGVQSLVD